MHRVKKKNACLPVVACWCQCAGAGVVITLVLSDGITKTNGYTNDLASTFNGVAFLDETVITEDEDTASELRHMPRTPEDNSTISC